MKGLIIGALAGLGVTAGLIIKAINDDRQEIVVSEVDNAAVVRKETFKQAAKRKVNEILLWVNENAEKVDGAIKAISTVTTVIGIVTAVVELYSSTKKAVKDPNEELLEEVRAIKEQLSGTPTVVEF